MSVLARKAAIGLLLGLLSACGSVLTPTQTDVVSDYAKATSALAELATDEMIEMQQTIADMKADRVAALGSGDMKKLASPLTSKQVAIRLRAIRALGDYADALTALLGDDQKKNLESAADKLLDSLSDVSVTKEATEAHGDAVRTAVTGIGGFFVERARAKAIRTTVAETKDIMLTLSNAIREDFTIDAGGLLTNYKTVAEGGQVDIQSGFLATNDPTARFMLMERYREMQARTNRAADLAAEIGNALKKFETAQAELVETLSGDKRPTSFAEYRAAVEELVDTAKAFKKRYK